MRNVFLISLTVALCMAACADKPGELKARNTKAGQQKTAEQAQSEKAAEEIDADLYMPKNTDNRKMVINGTAKRIIELEQGAIDSSFFCTDNLAQALGEKEDIKLQGNSQIIVRQVTTISIPERDSLNSSNRLAPKPLLSVACLGKSVDLSKVPENKDVETTNLAVGKSAAVNGIFKVEGEEHTFENIVIGCTTRDEMANADKILLPTEKVANTHVLMAEGSKMLLETSRKNPDRARYALITCNAIEETPAVPQE